MKANVLWTIIKQAGHDHPTRRFLAADARGAWISYGYLQDAVSASMQGLSQAGVRAGDRVAIQFQSPDQFVMAWLAVLTMDAVAVPIDSHAPSADRMRTIERTGAHFLLHDQAAEVPSNLGNICGDGVHWRLLKNPHGPRLTQVGPVGGLILLTSGTTGDPKPVGLPTASLIHTASHVTRVHQLAGTDVGYSPLPLFHINGEVVGVLATLLAGGAIVVSDRFHAGRFWTMANRYGATWLNLVPSILKVLIGGEGGPESPARIRFIRSASAPLPISTLRAIEGRWQIPVIETYGLSESASQVAANPLDAPRAGSVGRPVGTQIRVVDALGVNLGTGEVGEVEIRGPAVVDANWGPNRWAEAKYRRGWYRTGDLGWFDQDGYLYLVGRSRELINRGGEKIFPREVEEVILEHPGLVDCAVVGRPDERLGEEPVAFVVPGHDGCDPVQLQHELSRWVRERLSRFKCPAEYFVVNALPKGSTGKVARQSLRDHAMAVSSKDS